MNAEQLHAVSRDLKTEIESIKLIQLLEQLEKALQQAIGQPNQAEHQEKIGKVRGELSQALKATETNERDLAKRQIIAEIGGTELLGGSLLSRIETSFTQQAVTLQLVKNDISKMLSELREFYDGLNQLITGFKRFGIGFEELQTYTAELGVLIPRRENKDNLTFLSRDMKQLDQELQVFQELVTGRATRFHVRTISSSDFSIFLELLPETAQVIALTVAGVVVAYDKVLDIRLKRKGLKDAPEEVDKAIESWAESLMAKEIEAISEKLINDFSNVQRPGGRANEIESAIRVNVKKMAGRIDVGYKFSVRVGPPPQPEKDAEPTASDATRQDIVQSIKETASRLKQSKYEGEPILPVSWQPEDEASGDESDDAN